MITDNITRQQFIIQVLNEDVRAIYDAQLLIARENIYIEGKELKIKKKQGKKIGTKTGDLLRSLENPDYTIRAEGENFIVTANIIRQMRFLDMKKYGNWKIYNRQVWGILYNNSLRRILHGYGAEIRNNVRAVLESAFNMSLTKPKILDYGKAKGRTS
jgi:hypothetical protein